LSLLTTFGKFPHPPYPTLPLSSPTALQNNLIYGLWLFSDRPQKSVLSMTMARLSQTFI